MGCTNELYESGDANQICLDRLCPSGIVLLVTGAGLSLFVEKLDAVKEGSEMVEEQIGMRI